MTPVISLLVVITLSILCTRIATVALVHTGLSREVARFQARSAFTGVGFTTGESEKVIRHPVRRRIVMALMWLGNVGIMSAIFSLILTFVGQEQMGLFSPHLLFPDRESPGTMGAGGQWVDRPAPFPFDKLGTQAIHSY